MLITSGSWRVYVTHKIINNNIPQSWTKCIGHLSKKGSKSINYNDIEISTLPFPFIFDKAVTVSNTLIFFFTFLTLVFLLTNDSQVLMGKHFSSPSAIQDTNLQCSSETSFVASHKLGNLTLKLPWVTKTEFLLTISTR